jgi:hypothetical protein
MNHDIDLSRVPHLPGRSTDLEPKRLRAWARLTDDERAYVTQHFAALAPETRWRVTFGDMKDTYERVLYVLAVTDLRFSPAELTYMMIARWYRNVDQATVRAKLADLVNRGEARSAYDGRVHITANGRNRLDEIDNSRNDEPPQRRRRPARRQPSPGHGASGAREQTRFASVDRDRPSRPTERRQGPRGAV